MKFLYIVDLDGVLADSSKRFEKATRQDGSIDWDVAFDPKHIPLDIPIEAAVAALSSLPRGYELVYLSSRPEAMRLSTVRWLRDHDLLGPCVILKDERSKFIKTTVWKRLKVQELATKHQCPILFVDDEQRNRDHVADLDVHCFATIQEASDYAQRCNGGQP